MRISLEKIQELNGADLCQYISKEHTPNSAISDALKLIDLDQHPIKKKENKISYELVPQGYDEDGMPKPPKQRSKTVILSKAGLDIANYIINQKKMLVTGAGVGLDSNGEDDELFEHVKRNWEDVKFEYDVGEFFKTMQSETQCAVILFGEKGKKDINDFSFKYKIASPSRGDVLIPVFDKETDDFIGLQREYEDDGDSITDLYYKFSDNKPRLKRLVNNIEVSDNELPYSNLPIIYWGVEEGGCANVEDLIYTYEGEVNSFIDTTRYFADPILFANGDNMELPFQTDSGKIMMSKSPNGKLEYVTPDNATEMRELQFNMLEKSIFMYTRSVMMDAKSLQGLGKSGLSGEAIERYMADAYMDAASHQTGYFGKGVQRLVNWLTKEWIDLLGGGSKLRVKATFRKYSLRGDADLVDLYLKANGGEALISREEAVKQAGLARDLDFLNPSN